jgi:hypothetical protein
VTLLPQPIRAPRATIVMPTLPDAGRLGGGPHAGPRRAQARIGRTRRGTRGPGVCEVFAVGRGAGFVVLAEVTARAASELRLADGGPVWATVEAPGWPATGLNGTGPGLWRVLRRGTTAHAPNATNLASGSEDAKGGGGTQPQVNPSANPCDGSIRTGTQEMAETGRFAAPGSARKWRHPPRRSSTCPPRSSTPTASSFRTAAARSSTRKPTTGLVEKCSRSWSPRAEHLEGASLGELEGDEVGLLLAGGQAEDRLEECPPGPGTRLSWCLPNQCT